MKKILMLGTSPDTCGGIAAVIKVYREAGLFDRWPIVYLPTHRDGKTWSKAATAIGAWLRFAALLAFGNVGLVYVHSASGPSFWRKSLFILPALLMRQPVVFHLHGGGFKRFLEQRCGPLRRGLARWILRRTSRIVVLSDSWRHWMNELLGRDDVLVIPNPVFVSESAHREAFPPMLLFLGRLSREKGVDDLLRAFALLAKDHPAVRLVCAGDGNQQRVIALAKALGVERALQLPGWVEKEDKEKLLSSAAIFVLPSHIEAMPMSLLEAMAWGVPVVATRVGSVPEVIADGEIGVLVAPGNVAELKSAIDRLLSNPAERERMGMAAKQHVARAFGHKSVMDKMAALFLHAGITERGRA